MPIAYTPTNSLIPSTNIKLFLLKKLNSSHVQIIYFFRKWFQTLIIFKLSENFLIHAYLLITLLSVLIKFISNFKKIYGIIIFQNLKNIELTNQIGQYYFLMAILIVFSWFILPFNVKITELNIVIYTIRSEVFINIY